MASLSTFVPFLNHERLSTIGAPNGGEMLSNEVVETEDGSFPPLASTVAMMLLADGMENAGERKQEDNPSVFTHRRFFSQGWLYNTTIFKVRLDV